MRQPRIKIDPDEFDAVYHCISRVVAGDRLLDARSREVLRKMLWEVAEFCGIEILTYILLSNHFHIYLLVPKRTPLSDEELLRRYAILHPRPTRYETRRLERIREQLATNGPLAVDFRRRMRRLMNNVSCFMQLLKQRFTLWYNDDHERFGTLWSGRFKSLLNEIDPEVNTAVGAYIDLNSVRAGLRTDPKDYRFSGYAEALAGNARARKGIMFLTGCDNWESASARYRQAVFAIGSAEKEKGAKLSVSQLLEVIRQGGRLPLATLLHCRIRYLTEGLILGSPEFVQRHLGLCQKDLVRPRRTHVLPCHVEGKALAIPKRLRGPVLA